MPSKSRPLPVTEEQALWFRAQRGHLAGKGAKDEGEVVRAVLGIQAQQLAPALWAVAMRCQSRPTAEEVAASILEEPRSLVRTWGQRHTLHLYEPAEDWPTFLAAQGRWAGGGRRGDLAPQAELDQARKRMQTLGRPATRKDLFAVLTKRHLREWEDKASSKEEARRFAAGRLFWGLARHGELSVGHKVGAEQAYVLRADWFPKLRWRKPSAAKAAMDLARRYLALHGPATVKDLAHYYGAHVKDARAWLDDLEKNDLLVSVSCGQREGLVALAEDARELRRKPPTRATEWPVRLVPNYDTLLMGHADKSWTVPTEDECSSVWRRAAYVSAVVLARGRVVAMWTHMKKARKLRVVIEPLSGWRSTKHAKGVEREAQGLARHFQLEEAEVTIGS